MRTINKFCRCRYSLLVIILAYGRQASGQQQSVKADGGLIFEMAIGKSNNHDSDIDATVSILKQRITVLGVSNPVVLLNKDRRHITVELPREYDSLVYKRYVLKRGRAQIIETFLKSEFSDSIAAANKLLTEKYQYPLFKILNLSDYLYDPCIGWVKGKDKILMDSMLRLPDVTKLFPTDMDFMWQLDDSKSRLLNSKYYNLLVVRKPISYIPINKTMIASAHAEVSMYGGGDYIVMFNLQPDYTQLWADMTRRNIRRGLAIVFEGNVLSCPVVNDEIPNGAASISGNFTKTEAEALAVVLGSRELPADLTITRITYVKAP